MARILTTQPELHYFGKFPARGDFVRSATGGGLMNVFDQWISRALDLLAVDPRWKIDYDATAPIRFAFVGTRSRTVVAGVLTPSMDSSERRFPFVLATHFDAQPPLGFFALSPLRLARYWQTLEMTGLQARQSRSDEQFLGGIGGDAPALHAEPDADAALLGDFLAAQTVETLDDELRRHHAGFSLRRSALALGLLLQPLMTQGTANLNKGLMFPLPSRADSKALVASFWLSLLSGFLTRHELELSILIATWRSKPVLVVGFAGAAAEALACLISPDADDAYLIDMSDAMWAEDYADSDAGCRKLSSYASHPQLSLTQLQATFNEVFLGL